jgi:hypothetical protein
MRADGRTDGRTDERAERQTDRHDDVNSRYSQFRGPRLKMNHEKFINLRIHAQLKYASNLYRYNVRDLMGTSYPFFVLYSL